MTSPLQKNIAEATERFVEEMTGLIREAAKEQVLQALGMSGWAPQLPMPNRKSRHLAAPKTRPPKELPPRLAKALRRIKKAKRPVTAVTLAKTLGTTEAGARQTLGKLLKKRLVTTKQLGDGTARKVYLPS